MKVNLDTFCMVEDSRVALGHRRLPRTVFSLYTLFVPHNSLDLLLLFMTGIWFLCF